jgi:DNA polymerase-3 subunit delta
VRFSEFRQYQPKQAANVFGFVCEDEFLVEESRSIWLRIFGDGWVFDKYSAKEFEDIPFGRLMDDALTPSLFSQNRILIVTNAEKTTKGRMEDLATLAVVPGASLRVILTTNSRRIAAGWPRGAPVIEIDDLKPADVARWLMERYKLAPDVARYLVEAVGTDLYQLNSEIQKLQTYVGPARAIEVRDIDVLILRSEQFGPYELDDALIAGDYRKCVKVVGAMLDDGVDPLRVLGQIVRVWRQLFVGKSLSGKRSAGEVAAAAGVPAFKSGAFAAACKKHDWKQLAGGFGLLLNADRALKSSTPNPEGYFDVMLWKMLV